MPLLSLTRSACRRSALSTLCLLGLEALVPAARCAADDLSGETSSHDPSTIVKDRGEYWLFSTGNGLRSRHAKDLRKWEAGPAIIQQPPAWIAEFVPGNRGHFWAPDVIRLDNRFYLYFSASTFGKNVSGIGLLSSPTLDPSQADYGWRDDGVVVRSGAGDKFNAIDPAVTLDAEGRLWMSFGSFWSGIKLLELDPRTGLRLAPDSPIHSLAQHSSIEAPAIHREGDFYYLFVNWGLCCRGVESTYEIRMGRSRKITGPYLDREGVDLMDGGGTEFLESAGSEIGPGHVGIFAENGMKWVTYHFYDASNRGRARFAVRPLQWSADGWPEIAAGVSASSQPRP